MLEKTVLHNFGPGVLRRVLSVILCWCVGVRNNRPVPKIEKFDLCPDEAKALKGVELKATKQRLVMFGRVI